MKIALVTGGSRGLGKNAVQKFGEKGVDVILTYRSKKAEAEEVIQELEKIGRKAVALQLDVGDSKSFSRFAEEVKKVLKETWNRENFDFLVNNAGIGINAPITETTEDQFDELMRVHLKGPYFLTQKLLPLMANGGRIINLSSGLARFALPGYSAYAAMKGAIEVFTRYLAKELGPRGIVVNTVAPGAIETDFSGGLVRDNRDVNKMIASTVALGRVGVPDDIGGVIASLCTDDMRWVNAQRIEVSGGTLI